MKCFLLWIDEQLPALTDGINRAVHRVSNGLRTWKDLVVIASLQPRDIVRLAYVSVLLKSTVNTMYKTHIKTTCFMCIANTQGCTETHSDDQLHTSYVLSPKKWISSYSFSTYCKQKVLSQPWGKISKLICPPMEYVSPRWPNFFLRASMIFFLKNHPLLCS